MEDAKISIPEKSQFKILQYEIPEIELDITYINKANICFRSGIPLYLISKVQVNIPLDIINFYVMDIPTLFLLCLKDMDILDIYLNNITNQLICKNGKIFLFFVNGNIFGFCRYIVSRECNNIKM